MARLTMKTLALAALLAAAGGCGSGDDQTIDTTTDRAPDVVETTDQAADTPAEGDTRVDVPVDTPAGEDAAHDAPAEGDAATEELPPGCHTIAQVRAAPDGAADFTLCNVPVTYVYASGYYVQYSSPGPAIQVYEGSSWTPDRAPGDVVTIHVTHLTTYKGNREVDAHDPVTVVSTGGSVAGIVQDLSAGVVPSEDLESELVKVTGATVTAISSRDVTISYGTATGVALRVDDSGILCVGATFTVQAVVTEWADTSSWRIQSSADADFTSIDTTPCGGSGRAPAAGELIVNEFLADPPDGTEGDANCDGTRDGVQDEFVEIVNVSADALSLAGVKVSDTTAVRHTFPAGTSLAAGKVFVVFGGGTLSCTWTGSVQKTTASGGSLRLNNDGDTITVADSSGTTLSTLTYTGDGNVNQSMTLNPDLNDTDSSITGVGGFVTHTTANASKKFSPGTKVDGTAF